MKVNIGLLILIFVTLISAAEYKKRKECVFPFKYNGKVFDDCVTFDAGAPWCSPTAEYTGVFFYCNDNEGDTLEKNGAFLSSQKKLMDNKKILDKGNFSTGEICTNCGLNLQVVESSLNSLTKLSDDNERQLDFLMEIENKNIKDFLKVNYEDIKEYLHCPSGWYSLTDTDCFHFGPSMALSEAMRYCEGKGSQVLSINNMEENKLILEKASYVLPPNNAFLLGMTDEQTEGKFRWIDNSESSFLNWSDYEPNNYAGKENCVMVYTSTGKWNDFECKDKLYAVCRGQQIYVK